MSDLTQLLRNTLEDCTGSTLLVADENCLEFAFAGLPANVTVISNRVDVAARAREAGVPNAYSDFDFTALGGTVDNVVFRIAKEKPVVHHIVNGAGTLLSPGGKLWLLGGKQEGIKTFAKTVGKSFGSAGQLRKEGAWYTAVIEKNTERPEPLDDRKYHRLRPLFTLHGQPVMSKPGLFGWDKLDRGSALLVARLPEFIAGLQLPAAPSLLDLGCGYGYLSLAAAALGDFTITATDNCAAATIACGENFRLRSIRGQVCADDCGATIQGEFDLILCNPPFHQGFQQDRKLTEKFLSATRRLLRERGRALFVVNQFVPLETLARGQFRKIDVPVTADGFKLVALGH